MHTVVQVTALTGNTIMDEFRETKMIHLELQGMTPRMDLGITDKLGVKADWKIVSVSGIHQWKEGSPLICWSCRCIRKMAHPRYVPLIRCGICATSP